MDNKHSSITNSYDLLNQIHCLSAKIDELYSNNKKETYISSDIYFKLSSYFNEIIDLLKSNKDKNKYFDGLCQIYQEKQLNLSKLKIINELKECAENKRPQQTHKDMFVNIISNCIISCENLKKNNVMITKIEESSKSSKTSAKSTQGIQEGSVSVDFERLKLLYNELLECSEITDVLYADFNDKKKELEECIERLNEESEKI